MNDIKRNITSKAKKLLDMFPVLAIIGARQVGKTTLAKMLKPDWKYVDLEDPDDFRLLSENPKLFFNQHKENIIIDEAQAWPEIFSVLRGVIDQDRQVKGRFILTGSSSPELLDHISESLAGRIATIELGTLKTNEYFQKPLSPFYTLFQKKINLNDALELLKPPSPLSLSQIQKIWLKGGYPEPLIEQESEFYSQWMENYRDTYVNRDIARLFPRLNRIRYQRFLGMLSKLSGTILNKRDLGRAVEVNETTIKEYIDIADGTFIWKSLPSFEKNVVKSIIKMPKGYIRDSGLLHHLLRIHSMDELMEDPCVGASFEGFVIDEILKGLNATMVTNWKPYYYRTRNGAEIDLILEGPFGTVPIEIKYGSSTTVKRLSALSRFLDEHELPMGMLINQSPSVELVTPKIIQVPAAWI